MDAFFVQMFAFLEKTKNLKSISENQPVQNASVDFFKSALIFFVMFCWIRSSPVRVLLSNLF